MAPEAWQGGGECLWLLGCCVSQRKVRLCLTSSELSPAPPGSGNKPRELRASLQAEPETEMQFSSQGEREAAPVSLCSFLLIKCVADPDALKDHSMGQLASLDVALHSSWECLELQPSSLILCSSGSCLWGHLILLAIWGVSMCMSCFDYGLLGRHFSACDPCPVSSSLAHSGERVSGADLMHWLGN